MSEIVHSVTLLGVTFTATGEGGIGYTKLTDWYGVPEARGDLDPIPGAHGSYRPSKVTREARAITLEGAIHAPTRAELDALRQQLTNQLTGEGEMIVVDNTGQWRRWVIVQFAGIDDVRSSAAALPVTIDMLAPDPVRYSDPLGAGPAGLPWREGGLILPQAFPWHFGESVQPVATVTNTGVVPVYPRATIRGSASAITLHGAGRRLQYGAFDGELIFDSAERRVWLNGSDVTRWLTRRDWPVVQPGQEADFYFSATAPDPETVLESVEYQIGVW